METENSVQYIPQKCPHEGFATASKANHDRHVPRKKIDLTIAFQRGVKLNVLATLNHRRIMQPVVNRTRNTIHNSVVQLGNKTLLTCRFTYPANTIMYCRI